MINSQYMRQKTGMIIIDNRLRNIFPVPWMITASRLSRRSASPLNIKMSAVVIMIAIPSQNKIWMMTGVSFQRKAENSTKLNRPRWYVCMALTGWYVKDFFVVGL